MSRTPQDSQMDKHAYHTPEVRDYGTVRELTQGSSSNDLNKSDNITINGRSAAFDLNAPVPDGLGGYITG